ncbi:DUF1904 domain-containing protein [Catenovulum sp. 2E275]|uniref:DUF1904 domain-containing protein n=1 Tax=Catenovulum sp. 2E275 TaxID=2980497 RepID=UPI0021CE7995|nr:DUF1904 domain-containing protein [Catenovulum sp. 2E275]MCU4675385.1 DUF1904 domain-containing protein [Catenovulum sp. 2E275]
MPHLRFFAVEENVVEVLSESLAEELAQIIDCPVDYFTMQVMQSQFYRSGKKTAGEAYVEVHWFARSQVLQNQFAEHLNKRLKAYYPEQDITVTFTQLAGDNYYENGEHF